MKKRAKIIELNDKLRTTFKGGRVQMTPAVLISTRSCAAVPSGRWPGATSSPIPASTTAAS